jgi:CBS domain-containing protein
MGIGPVVVSTDGETADGILSERDIVRELGKNGSGCLEKPVSAYMTTKLVTCSSQSNVEDVLQQMTAGRFRHMPVVEDGKIVGLVSLGDVVKAQLTEIAMEKDALEGMIMGH